MKRIIIPENRLSEPRLAKFQEWKNNKTQEQLTTEKPSKLWSKFVKTKCYDELKDFLLENQGKICCYCGSPLIKPNHADIEHLIPKSKDSEFIFDEHNLFVACSTQKEAGENITIEYQVTEKEVERFSNDWERFKNYLCNTYSTNESNIYWKKGEEKEPISSIKKFPEGKKLLFITAKPKNICNNSKNNSLIHFDLKDEKLDSYFSYNDTGEILATNVSEPLKTEIQNDLDNILNLNCRYLKECRTELYKAMQQTVNELFESSENIQDDLYKLINGYAVPNEYSELEPYCFVKIYVIQNFLSEFS